MLWALSNFHSRPPNLYQKAKNNRRVFYSSDFSVVNFFEIALVFVTGHRYWLWQKLSNNNFNAWRLFCSVHFARNILESFNIGCELTVPKGGIRLKLLFLKYFLSLLKNEIFFSYSHSILLWKENIANNSKKFYYKIWTVIKVQIWEWNTWELFFASGHCVGSESSDIVHLPEILLKV